MDESERIERGGDTVGVPVDLSDTVGSSVASNKGERPDRSTGLHALQDDVRVGSEGRALPGQSGGAYEADLARPASITSSEEPGAKAIGEIRKSGIVLRMRGENGGPDSEVRVPHGYWVDSNGVVMSPDEVIEELRTR
ncbi:MAG: hypothetical protein UZ21_OP11001000074 [Microgenomates bacterium OLB22]|nr:MAG: hypothetical protein UZ21_OP11001000074 [Microgenomates bacterium OLB22]